MYKRQGTLVYLIFAIPVEQFVLNPEIKVTLSGVSNNIVGRNQENGNGIGQGGQGPSNNITFSTIQLYSVIFSVMINLLFGITLGLVSSLLSIKFGARYRCPSCDISFSRIDTSKSFAICPWQQNNEQKKNRNFRRRVWGSDCIE